MVSVQLGPIETLVQAASKHLASPIKLAQAKVKRRKHAGDNRNQN